MHIMTELEKLLVDLGGYCVDICEKIALLNLFDILCHIIVNMACNEENKRGN